MRGSDERRSLFSYVDWRRLSETSRRSIRRSGAAVDPTGAADAGDASAGVLRDQVRAAADGADGVRSVVLWFAGLGVDAAAWDNSSFSKNRDRLLAGEIAGKFLRAVLAQPRVKRLMSSDHFSVDGTLIEARASLKSFRKRDGSNNDPHDARRRLAS